MRLDEHRHSGSMKGRRLGIRPPATVVDAPHGRGYTQVMTTFKAGDEVTWQSHGGQAVGRVVRKLTSDTEAAGRAPRAGRRRTSRSIW